MICPADRHPHYCELARRPGVKGEQYREFLRTGALPAQEDRPQPSPALRKDKRIRVGFHTPSFYRGGAERWILDLARTLDAMRFVVVGFSCTNGAIGSQDIADEARTLAPILVGRHAVRELDRHCDALIAWGDADVPRLIGDRRNSRVVIVSHTSGDWGESAVKGWEDADGLVAVSTVALEPFPEEARPRVEIIPNAFQESRVVPKRRRDEVREGWGILPGEKVLGVLGRISPEKGPDHLIRAVDYLPWRWRGVHVGDGLPENRARYAAMAETISGGRVTYPGYDPEVGSVLHAFDAFLLPSSFEGSSLALLEAWAAGIPCLTTPVGIALEHPEWVRMLEVPVKARDVAIAVLDDEMDEWGTGRRVREARDGVERLYSGREWAKRWGEYLTALVGDRHSSSVRTTIHRTGFPYSGDLPPMPNGKLKLLHEDARTCRYRGCRASCTKFECDRFGAKITVSQCVECVLNGGRVAPLDARVQPLREKVQNRRVTWPS
jgi:glycosyltransferase involved in cell wall biosynthesis